MTKLWFLFVIFPAVFSIPPKPFDFIEQAILQYRNKSVDPCDDFYRHACSFDAPKHVVEAALAEVNEYIEKVQEDSYWNHLDIIKEFKNIKDKRTLVASANDVNKFIETAHKTCLYQKSSDKRTSNQFIGDIFDNNTEDCSIISDLKSLRINAWGLIAQFKESIGTLAQLAGMISAHLDVDVRRGIEETRDMVMSVLNIARDMIKDTPWVRNNHLVETIEKITGRMKIYDNYGGEFENITNALFMMEKFYTKCKFTYSYIENSDLLCYLLAAANEELPQMKDAFFLEDNAVNEHPNLYFGFPLYYHMQYGTEMAAKIGYVGTGVGHEIGHTFFGDEDHILPYFSKAIKKCVQNQFNSTCTEYKEESCITNDNFLEENGADIFGIQLAYILLQNYYGDNLYKKINELKMTYEQLFFYSYAMEFCSGDPSVAYKYSDGSYDVHSAKNVRVNILVQHPAFKDAFNCSPKSRMMKSATKQCFIYGKHAPENRKIRRSPLN